MLNEEQNDVVIKQFEIRQRALKCTRENLTRRMADVGQELNNVIEQLDEVEDVLASMKKNESCECEE